MTGATTFVSPASRNATLAVGYLRNEGATPKIDSRSLAVTNLFRRSISATLLTAGLALCPARLAASRPLVSADDWIGLWRGTYVCNQGITGLFLTVRRSSADDVTAVFRFFAIPENPGVPIGEYEMAGRLGSQNNHLQLLPLWWIQAPPQYVMVGLKGDYDEATGEYSGRVLGPGCAKFILRRDLVS
jgi:hypothetical protein